MTLSTGEVALIRNSYAVIGRAPRSYSELFYHRLLHRHPFARVLFPDDMTHQIEVFRRTIDALIDQLDGLTSLRPTLADLACRHVGYGVEARHYAIVGEVLIDTFAEMLRDRFNAQTRAAWHTLYADTAGVMIAETYPAVGTA